MSTFKAAFLTDLGKVILDYDWYLMFHLLEQQTGQPVGSLAQRFFGTEQKVLADVFCRGSINNFVFHREFCSVMGIEPSQLPYDKFKMAFESIPTGKIDGMMRLLPLIRERFDLMIMITNNNTLHFNATKQDFPEIFKPFDLVIASHEVCLLKPERAIYRMAIEFMAEHGIRPENSLFVDDLQENLDGAKEAGIGHTFLFYPGKEAEFCSYLANCWQIDCG